MGIEYPQGLLDWSGDKAGGVKKLFYTGSGRPSGDVITTGLLERLKRWAVEVASGSQIAPKAVFLVGGPGNGKTEAVEFTIRELDVSMGLGGALVGELATRFGQTTPPPGRLVRTSSTKFPACSGITSLSIVQDGSEAERADPATPAEQLCRDVRSLLEASGAGLYLACVNRGVLDDALILATERGDPEVGELMKRIVQSATLRPDGISCWPLEGYPAFAVWPMDVDSLVEESVGSAQSSAARQIFQIAADAGRWPDFGSCDAGEHCPFCTNRKLLSAEPHLSSLIRVLRWFELSSGKRWNFRDLFSLSAYLLAGTTEVGQEGGYHPCKWAKSQISVTGAGTPKGEAKKMRGLLKLLAAQYQHAIFGAWPLERASQLRSDIKELKLEEELPMLVGLQQFLSLDKKKEATSTLRTQLAGIGYHLDPAFASPGLEVALSSNTTKKFEELDRRFSLSIKEGRFFLQKFHGLSALEVDILKALEQADARLSDNAVRRQKPAVAERVQAFIRLVACRVARRSFGMRSGITKDSDVLVEFNDILNGDTSSLQRATQRVEGLLNKDRRFLISLNTTFGEPLPPPERRVMLTTDIQKVRQVPLVQDGSRPRLPVRFLYVGTAAGAQPVALTYELFKATKSLGKGMVPASLPRSVVALLDTTRAKLAGRVVRDEELLEGSEIRLGIRDDVIVRNFSTFVVRKEQSK